jgi:dihydrofolate synthase/folylpolyglutamate synthase
MFENDTLQFLNNLQKFGWKLSLDGIMALLKRMGDPHLQLKSIHVAGTNGKGSTAAMLDSIFRNAGYKTGLFTSPHLLDLRERIKVSGTPISWERLQFYIEQIKNDVTILECTYFETLTAIAFKYFAEMSVDIAIVEVGLGGRLDATNVLKPQLSIITEIDLDHREHLGSTKSKIAREKGGIIKTNVPCLSFQKHKESRTILTEIARDKNSKFYNLYDFCAIYPKNLTEAFSQFDLVFPKQSFLNLKLRLIGEHQLKNAALATAATLIQHENFVVQKEDIYQGLKNVYWPGRLEKLQNNPQIVVDVAHNPAAIRKLVFSLKTLFKFERILFILGILEDKDYKRMIKIIQSIANSVILVTPQSPRALSAQVLAKEIGKCSDNYLVIPSIKKAFEKALALSNENDLICVTGSHYTVGEFLKYYKNT